MKEKILVSLSDPTLSGHLKICLEDDGYFVVVAQTGPESLQKMRAEKFDLVVIDLVLPEKSGYEVLEEKTLDRFLTKIPVVIVSNTGATVEMRKIPSTPSIRDYVIKSHVEPEEIVEKIVKVFGRVYVPKSIRMESSGTKKTGKKVLWVEDDKLLGNILVKKFESAGHTIWKATNGEEALAILGKDIPDIIFLDILLPGMSGFDLLKRIKMLEKIKKVPVIMLSNMSKPSDMDKAKMLGAKKFLVKAAVSLDEIVREVE